MAEPAGRDRPMVVLGDRIAADGTALLRSPRCRQRSRVSTRRCPIIPLLPAFLHRIRLDAVRRRRPAIDPWYLAAVLEGLRLRMDAALRIIARVARRWPAPPWFASGAATAC